MNKCKHICPTCKEEWECEVSYFSDYKYFETSIKNGYYCNAWCPNCRTDKRIETEQLFNDVLDNGYFKSFGTQFEK